MSTEIIHNQTIKSILLIYAKKLKQNKIKNPHLETEILLAYILKKTREYLFTYPDKILTKTQISKLDSLILSRIKGKPIAYLIKKKQFYGLDFYVDKNVLIPRPETELLINLGVRHPVGCRTSQQTTIIDVGTGSGCIIVTLAKIIKSNTNNQFIAIDISKKALQIAKKNAKTHGVKNKIKFIHSDLLDNKKLIIAPHCKLIIIANLPYLTPTQIKNSPSIQHEPKLALAAGSDGLKYYKKLFSQIKKLQKNSKANIDILCEIDPLQVTKIKNIINKILPNSKIEVKKDLSKKERIIVINLI